MNLDSNEKVNQSAAKKQPKHHAKKHKHMNLKASLVDSNLLSEKAGPLLWEDIHEAKVQKIEDDRVFVEILNPAKPEPLIALASKLEFDLPICEGSKVCVYLEKPFGLSQADNMPKASIKKAQELSELKALSGLVEARESVKGFIASPVKGGYSVTLMVNSREEAENGLGLRAFLPLSQATLGREVPVFSDNVPFMFKVKEFEPKTGNIIVSLKDILLKKKREKEKQFWENAKEGSLVTGVVRSLVSYGAFVDVGGVDGLLHVSDMSWDKQLKIKELVHVGQTLEAQILQFDKKAKKLKLGLKQLTLDPWQSIKAQFKPGLDVEGDVVAIFDFGVFVHLADGIEGLIHLSEISWNRVKHPSNRFRIGDKVNARILSVDEDNHKISLSTKALESNPVEQLALRFPVGAVLKTRIANIKSYGVFVELTENLLGLVHIGELSWTQKIENPSEIFTQDQEVEVVVLGFDTERQRVSCSIKRTSENPWVLWKKKYAKGTRHTVVVKRLVNQGAECELEPSLLGFCPTRELSLENAVRPQDVTKVGEELNIEVTHCDPNEMQITLSVRVRENKETKEDYQSYLEKQSKESNATVTLKDALEEQAHKESL